MKRIKASWILSVPFGSTIKVAEKQRVKSGQVVCQYNLDTEEVFDLQNQLKGIAKEVVESINEKYLQKNLKDGELIYEKKGFWGTKIITPREGIFNGVDQWHNLHIIVKSQLKDVISPIEAEVGVIKMDEIQLMFEAIEYQGKGLNNVKTWVGRGIKNINALSNINFECQDKLILFKEFKNSWMIKAEVVGVGAVVVLDNELVDEDDRINFTMPVIKVSRSVFDDLAINESGAQRILVNGVDGKILLILNNKND